MELFLHTEAGEDPTIIEVETAARVRELLVDPASDGRIWIEDVDEDVDLDLTFDEAGIHHRHHVHRGRCHRIEVVVRFNGENFAHSYGPGTTIGTVYRWASGRKATNLSPEQVAKHVLAVPGSDHFLADGVQIGSLIQPGTCKVVLDLLPRDRFAG